MKTLYLLRHAKAERDSPSGEDFDRALAARGRRESVALGRFLADRDWKPDLVVYSPAARTAETTELVLAAWTEPPANHDDRSLYLAEAERIAACVQELSDSVSSAMIVGHNPGLEAFAGACAERGDRSARRALNEGFPTCTLAVFELDIERWSALSPKSARLVGLYVGKDIAEAADAKH